MIERSLKAIQHIESSEIGLHYLPKSNSLVIEENEREVEIGRIISNTNNSDSEAYVGWALAGDYGFTAAIFPNNFLANTPFDQIGKKVTPKNSEKLNVHNFFSEHRQGSAPLNNDEANLNEVKLSLPLETSNGLKALKQACYLHGIDSKIAPLALTVDGKFKGWFAIRSENLDVFSEANPLLDMYNTLFSLSNNLSDCLDNPLAAIHNYAAQKGLVVELKKNEDNLTHLLISDPETQHRRLSVYRHERGPLEKPKISVEWESKGIL